MLSLAFWLSLCDLSHLYLRMTDYMLLNRAQVGLTSKLCSSVITYQKGPRDSFEMSFPYTYREYFVLLNMTIVFFWETVGKLPAVFVETEPGVLKETCPHFQLYLWWLNWMFYEETWGHFQLFLSRLNLSFLERPGYKTKQVKPWCFPNLNQLFSVPKPKQIISTLLWQ